MAATDLDSIGDTGGMTGSFIATIVAPRGDAAMTVAARGEQAAYIEVVTDTYVTPPLAQKLHESTKTLYGLQ